ncbi:MULTISPECIES: trans-aconitate 2-methyltransferase [unclassified Arthrobacter]|uniref:trans-aconitate 2-methyltransferase n=1 Tax=unclassified Arthrobacter TaxID=235627 RepID=UPI001D13CC49|nr:MULTISPECIES: trans-aconitate 2-methyltransferase [unclassified Arthrobacter]MCC3291098.1 trans-aconitate 2-methyltransferase [Arthrobacter sp. zg-Y1110]MCC3301502.1 trans-aconitate 2-methyltransferase [Arthrobacter sp. zg-Y895]UWX83536.1 trans-aconitate 2-methyltransferase [Arthrobacter sp. zg-Y1110]
MKWDPEKYTQFSSHRDRPFFDLTARVAASSPARVVDLGCGTGVLTAALAARWPQAQVTGVDSSEEMIASARALEGAPSNLDFVQGRIEDWEPEPGTDVVVSNAALQWVPGHQELLRRWAKQLDDGAWLAVQVPGNFTAPSHVLMRELAASAAWAPKLEGVLRHADAVDEPGDYLALFTEAGFEADVWETSYAQVLAGEDPVLEWVRGTALRPVIDALSAEDFAAFETEYAALLRQAYPRQAWGTVFPFRRLFMVGRKKA